ncbi:MAG: hypothetical protein K2P88_07835 [Chitinophagaceae bacterium]|nr:hypothetical protein [Chitinophagaceae bacterium]
MAKKCENNSDFNKPTVVFAMLDWGLGHVSRTIPIIKLFQKLEWNIVIACDSNQYKILFPLFPTAEFQTLPGYQISFGKTRVKTLLKIIGQSIKILTKIKLENKWITLFLRERKAQLIISDNRYGFYHPAVPSVIITHQLRIKSGLGSLVDRILFGLNKKHLSRFNQVWIPDTADATHSIAGILAHTTDSIPTPIQYLGPISRLQSNPPIQKKRKYLAVLSGPEPQRSILEEQLTTSFNDRKQALTILCGKPDESSNTVVGSVEKIGFPNQEQLNQLIEESEYIISRSGYSSLMDYSHLQSKSILIPTPGQAEQEYLAHRFADIGYAAMLAQENVSFDSIEMAVQSAAFMPFPPDLHFNQSNLETKIKDSLKLLIPS